jgi:protein-L-isoaspartate(D-aspartate) O-methyltransferase
MRNDPLMKQTGNDWHQVTFWCRDWQTAEHVAATRIGPLLREAEDTGTVTCWWFVRKGQAWRLRLRPAPDSTTGPAPVIDQAMAALAADGMILSWAASSYEPEMHAFGGKPAMTVAHALFHADSSHILRHLGHGGPAFHRELGLLLAAILMRAAGQDWYEQGDIWLRAAAHRHDDRSGLPAPDPGTVGSLRQLITTPVIRLGEPLRSAPAWPEAWQQAGQDLADLAWHGKLTRGLRAVLTHHVLFAWNRLGIPAAQQHTLAATAGHIVFRQTPWEDRLTVTCPATVSAVTHTTHATAPEAAQLRNTLADHIARLGTFQTTQVETAFRTVPRHLFLPGTPLEDAYAPRVVVTKRSGDGSALSSASSPNVVAAMLEQLDACPGHQILEIGAGAGINAALLAEITAPGGHVTTIDIDDDIVQSARRALAAAGYQQHVTVLCADGANGHPGSAPYDRIIATAGAWDLPRPWWQQLAPGGRLVVPVVLHGSGLTRSLAFDHTQPGQMTSSTAQVCGFVPMRGTTAAQNSRAIQLADDATLTLTLTLTLDPTDPADDIELTQALSYPAHQQWTGITTGDREPVAHLDLWLITAGCRFARLSAGPNARSGLADPALRWAGAAVHDGATIAYLATRPAGTEGRSELGVIANGPGSHQLADHTTELLHTWSQERPAQPRITAQPAGTPGTQIPPGYRVTRPETTLTITW